MNSLTKTEHSDITPPIQPYESGMFVSYCSCGREFTGHDPDDADAALIEHIDEATN